MINWKQRLRKVLSHARVIGISAELLVASLPKWSEDEYFSIDATIVDMAVKVMRCEERKEMHSFRSCRPFESKCSSVFHPSSPLMASNPFSSISFLSPSDYFLHISRAPYSSQTTDSAGAKDPTMSTSAARLTLSPPHPSVLSFGFGSSSGRLRL
jgi:hypothetical protein